MAVPSNPKLSDIIAEFGNGGNPTNLAAYVRGGQYVPMSANNLISTTLDGLAISQFAGANKSINARFTMYGERSTVRPNRLMELADWAAREYGAHNVNTTKTLVITLNNCWYSTQIINYSDTRISMWDAIVVVLTNTSRILGPGGNGGGFRVGEPLNKTWASSGGNGGEALTVMGYATTNNSPTIRFVRRSSDTYVHGGGGGGGASAARSKNAYVGTSGSGGAGYPAGSYGPRDSWEHRTSTHKISWGNNGTVTTGGATVTTTLGDSTATGGAGGNLEAAGGVGVESGKWTGELGESGGSAGPMLKVGSASGVPNVSIDVYNELITRETNAHNTLFTVFKTVSGTPQLPGTGYGVTTDDTYVYVSHWAGNFFSVIRKSDWSVVSGTPSLPSSGTSVTTDDTYVYLTHDNGKYFTVIRKADWSVVSGTPSLPYTGRGISTDDTYVYACHDGGGRLTIIRKSDWRVVTRTPSLPNTGYGITTDATYVYVAHSDGGRFTVFKRIDVSTVST